MMISSCLNVLHQCQGFFFKDEPVDPRLLRVFKLSCWAVAFYTMGAAAGVIRPLTALILSAATSAGIGIALRLLKKPPKPFEAQPTYVCTYTNANEYTRIQKSLRTFCDGQLRVDFDDMQKQITYYDGKGILCKTLLFTRRSFDSNYLTPQVSVNYRHFNKRKQDLLQAAQEFFHKRPFGNRQPIPYVGGNDASLITQLFQNHQGLCIGECHNRKEGRKFLIDNMEELKRQGVRTLFMEFLHYDTMQGLLEAYFQSKEEHVSGFLKHHLQSLDSGFSLFLSGWDASYSYTRLVEIAKKHGTRIVGIDTTISTECGMTSFGAKGKDRMLAMNFVAQKIIAHESQGRPFVALMGKNHLITSDDVPGVPKILDLSSIDFHPDQAIPRSV